MMFRSRKFILFLICLVIMAVLLFFDKPVEGVIGLYAVYCTGNVGTKIANKNKGETLN